MSIKKTKNGTYQLRLYIPEDVQAKLGLGKLFERKYKTNPADKHWDKTVAIAAPRIPRLSIKMKSGSRTILAMEPITTEIIPVVAYPCALMNGFIPVAIMEGKVPIR